MRMAHAIRHALLGGLVCFLGGAGAHGATLWVNGADAACSDSGPGTDLAPYCSISAAVAQAVPGTSVLVRPGVYREMITVPISGAAGSPLVIQGVGAPVVVDGSDDLGSPSLWTVASGSVYLAAVVTRSPVQVFVDGARLTPASGQPPGSLLSGSFSYVAGEGLYVNVGGGNPGLREIAVGSRLNGFRLAGKSWVTISGFVVTRTEDSGISLTRSSHNTTIQNNTVTFTGKRGIHVSASTNVRVASNVVSDCADHGIYFVSGVSASTIEDNESFRNARPASRAANGIQIYGSTGNLVQRNRLHDNQDSGVQISSASHNNLSLQNLSWSNGDHGYHHQASTGTRHIGDVAHGNASDGFALESGSTDTSLYDCIATDNGLTTGSYDLFVDTGSMAAFASDFNIIWNSVSQAPVRFGTSTYATLGAFATATGQDVRSIQSDPLFAAPETGDFSLRAGSPAIDSADSSVPGWPSADAHGISRIDVPDVPDSGEGPVLYADRGALEHVPNSPPQGTITAPAGNTTISTGTSVAFAGAATDADGDLPLSYRWDFGGGAPARTVLSPGAVVFSSPGTYSVTFTATDSLGLADPTPDQRVITVISGLPPAGTIDQPASNTTIDLCQSLSFAASASDPDGQLPLTYRWDFGGGAAVRTVQDPGPVAFTTPGVYTVTFTVTDALGISDPTPATRVVTVTSTTATNDEIHWTIKGQTSVTFNWRGPSNVIRYGLTPAYNRTVTAATPSPLPFSSCGPFREARLEGLQANTLYHYAIGTGPDHTFRTPPLAGSGGFTVYAEGDIGQTTSYSGMGPIQSLIAAARPAFTLMLGDLTYANDHGQSVVGQHFNDVMVWSQDAAYMPTWGNHEWDQMGYCSSTSSLDCNKNSDCPQGQTCRSIGDDLRNYKGRFDLPNAAASLGVPSISCCGEDWYWFDYGHTRFVSYPEPYTPETWAEWYVPASAVMDAAQADPSLRFIVTFGHRPAYSSGHHPGRESLATVLNTLGSTHSKYVLNLNGHTHGYERTTPQSGVVHVTVGTGGGSLQTDGACLWLMCAQPQWSAYRAMHLGALELRFGETGIEGLFVCGPASGGDNDVTCALGSVIDTFTIPPSPPTGVIDLPTSNVTIMAGQAVHFGGSATDPNEYDPLTYHWNFSGAAPIRTVEDPGDVVFSIPGTYTVTLTVANSIGLSDPTPDTRVIVVRPRGSRRPFLDARP